MQICKGTLCSYVIICIFYFSNGHHEIMLQVKVFTWVKTTSEISITEYLHEILESRTYSFTFVVLRSDLLLVDTQLFCQLLSCSVEIEHLLRLYRSFRVLLLFSQFIIVFVSWKVSVYFHKFATNLIFTSVAIQICTAWGQQHSPCKLWKVEILVQIWMFNSVTSSSV